MSAPGRKASMLLGLAAPALLAVVLLSEPVRLDVFDAPCSDTTCKVEVGGSCLRSAGRREALSGPTGSCDDPDPCSRRPSLPAWMEARALLLSACTATVLSDREDFLESALDWGDTERLGIHLSRDGSPEFTGPFFNPEEKPLLPIDQEQLDAIMLEFEALLSASAEHAFAQLVEGVERGISQEMYPYGAQGTISAQRRERPEDTLFSHHFIESAEGWSVYVQFESTDHLPFHEALRAHAELKERRNTRLREYVESL